MVVDAASGSFSALFSYMGRTHAFICNISRNHTQRSLREVMSLAGGSVRFPGWAVGVVASVAVMVTCVVPHHCP